MGNSLVKLVQRKRKRNDSSGDEHQHFGLLDHQHLLSSEIFKLNSHCFDELFEYLSLRDLHSLGQTCKSMQQMTGDFFTRNYSAAKFICLGDGIHFIYRELYPVVAIYKCIPIPGFIHLITWIAIENIVSAGQKYEDRVSVTQLYSYDLGKFKYVKVHADELKSVKKLTLTNVRINMETVRYFIPKNLLINIEVLELKSCTVYQDFYDVLLKFCKNVRHIELIELKCDDQYEWLLQQYENLEHLDLGLKDFANPSQRIDELSTFFELNPNIRKFSCTSKILLSNIDALLNCNVKLDTFELREAPDCRVPEKNEETPLWDLIYQLYTHGFYKYFHISTDHDLQNVYPLPEMPFLKRFSCCWREKSFGPLSAHLIEYAETFAGADWGGVNKTEFLIENLMNVERLHLHKEYLDIQLLIQQLRNLKKIKLLEFESTDILELDALNRARQKLAEAPKVTIYVPPTIYLATKWATKNGITNFGLIEMKRTTSYEWNVYDLSWPTLGLPKGFK